MTVSTATTAIGKALEELFKLLRENKESQSETELVKEIKSLKKAVDIAEELVDISLRYIRYFSENDRAKFRKLKKKFDKED